MTQKSTKIATSKSQQLIEDNKALMSQIAILKTQLEESSVNGLGNYIANTMTNWEDIYYHEDNVTGGDNDGWRSVDTMDFHKRIMLERMIGHYEYWLPKQSDRESKAKYFADRYKAEYSSDSELSRNNFMGAVARYKGDHMLTTLMNAELANLKATYVAQFNRSYSSLKVTAIDGDLPSDVAALMKEMDSMDAANDKPMLSEISYKKEVSS
tara:strand:+ start:812 stop:1444 length:633 start_codon:yes stop_codon:yes gene_type:complete